jgi:hypothetical protein
MAEQESTTQGQQTRQTTGPASERWLEETFDKVFITPRVVDEVAFDDLASSLKSLVKDAGAQSRALIETTGEVKLLGDQLREATRELQTRVDTAARVIPTLDQRVAKAEQLLDLTGRELALKVSEMREVATKGITIDRDRIEAQVRSETAVLVEQVLQEQVALLRARMTEALSEAQAKADSQAQALLSRLCTAQESLDRTLTSAEARVQSITQQMDQVVDQGLERARRGCEDAVARASESLSTPMATFSENIAEVEQIAAKAEAAHAVIDAAVKDAGLRLGAAIAEADRRAETIGQQAAVRIDELRQQAVEVVEIANSAKTEDILAVAQDTLNAARQSEDACNELRELVAAAGELTRLRDSLQAAGEGVESLTTRLTGLRADFEALTTQADSGLESKVRQMGAWLSQLVAQGDQIGRGLDRLIKQAGTKAEGLGGVAGA